MARHCIIPWCYHMASTILRSCTAPKNANSATTSSQPQQLCSNSIRPAAYRIEDAPSWIGNGLSVDSLRLNRRSSITLAGCRCPHRLRPPPHNITSSSCCHTLESWNDVGHAGMACHCSEYPLDISHPRGLSSRSILSVSVFSPFSFC